MAEAILMKGGGTVYSEDCTAVATDILNGKTALHLESNDEISAGSMTDNRSSITQHSNTTARAISNSIQIGKIAEGYYDASSTVSAPITSAFGNAVPTQVLHGSSFLHVAGKSVTTGSMPNYAGKSTTGGAIDLNSGSIRIKITNAGYYHTNSYVQAPASNFGNAVATQVLDSYTFTSSAGAKTTGSMVNFSGRTTVNALKLGNRTLSSTNIVYGKPQNSGYVNLETWINTQIPVYTGSIS